MVVMKRQNAYSSISQMPVVLIPIQFDKQNHLNTREEITNNEGGKKDNRGQHSVVLRTFLTKDFMTGRPAVPGETFPLDMLDEICQTIKTNVPGISRILYDLTSKPPGRICSNNSYFIFLFLATTEWE
jgi:GMP synthase (glutamine-hydrolysing)